MKEENQQHFIPTLVCLCFQHRSKNFEYSRSGGLKFFWRQLMKHEKQRNVQEERSTMLDETWKKTKWSIVEFFEWILFWSEWLDFVGSMVAVPYVEWKNHSNEGSWIKIDFKSLAKTDKVNSILCKNIRWKLLELRRGVAVILGDGKESLASFNSEIKLCAFINEKCLSKGIRAQTQNVKFSCRLFAAWGAKTLDSPLKFQLQHSTHFLFNIKSNQPTLTSEPISSLID